MDQNETVDESERVARDDERLAAKALLGDREARNELFMRLRQRETIGWLAKPAKRLLWAASLRGGGGAHAIEWEDVDQQAFLAFCKLLDQWDQDAETFAACLARRLPGQLLHYVRHSLLHVKREQVLEADEALRLAEDTVEGGAYTGAEAAKVVRLRDRRGDPLPPTLKEAVMLRYYGEMSRNNVARSVGRDRSTVSHDVQVALSLLREGLVEDWEGCG